MQDTTRQLNSRVVRHVAGSRRSRRVAVPQMRHVLAEHGDEFVVPAARTGGELLREQRRAFVGAVRGGDQSPRRLPALSMGLVF